MKGIPVNLGASLVAHSAAVAIDAGVGELAIAAVSALPAGPRRRLEVATWARRILRERAVLAFTVETTADRARLQAALEIDRAVRTELRRLPYAEQRALLDRARHRRTEGT